MRIADLLAQEKFWFRSSALNATVYPVPALPARDRRRQFVQGIDPFGMSRGPGRPRDIRRRGHVGVGGHPRGRVQANSSSGSLRDRYCRPTPARGVFGIEGIPFSPACLGVGAGAVIGDQRRSVSLGLPGDLTTPCDPSKHPRAVHGQPPAWRSSNPTRARRLASSGPISVRARGSLGRTRSSAEPRPTSSRSARRISPRPGRRG